MESILRVKDSNGNIIDIPALKGDKGDKGESGVYVGTGDMPEEYNVQIDPDGEPIVIPAKTSELENDSGFITSEAIPTKTSELTNDSGFITLKDIPESGILEETDPTVPDWAKTENPPEYIADDIVYKHLGYPTGYGTVGELLNALEIFYDDWVYTLPDMTHTHTNKETLDDIDNLFVRKTDMPTIYDWAKQPNPPTYTAADVGALPADTVIPSSEDIKAEVLAAILDTVPNAEGGSY